MSQTLGYWGLMHEFEVTKSCPRDGGAAMMECEDGVRYWFVHPYLYRRDVHRASLPCQADLEADCAAA